MEETCKNCRKKGFGLKRCTGCLTVSYCSKHCQAADWKDGHKTKCKKLKNSVGNLPDTKCASCGLSQNLMKCLGCYTVYYCSPICQQQHREVHKEDCIRSKSEIDDVIVTNGYKKHLEEEQENQREKSKFSWLHPLPLGLSGDKSKRSKTDSVDLSLRGSTSEKDRRQAKLFAERKFPLNHVTDDLERIQHGLIVCGSTQAFVAFILRYHENRERHGVYVQDVKEKDMPVEFNLTHDNPYPHFSWPDVRPGRFIVIMDPEFHHSFMERSVCIRINKGRNVFIFDI